MAWSTRRASSSDIEPIVELARQRRERYAAVQPRFWRPSSKAVDIQRSYFASLLDRDDVGVFVVNGDGQVRGFLIATIGEAPPVYDPSGPTCMVDDFVVDEDASWPTAGPLLLETARQWAAGRGAVQMVVVTGRHDQPKREQLAAAGLALTSEWWTGPTDA